MLFLKIILTKMIMMRKFRMASLFLLTGAFTFACTQSPKSDEAQVGEAQEVVEAGENATTYAIDKSQSTVTWVGTKPTGRHDGLFPIEEGSLQVEGNKVVGGTITFDLRKLDVTDADIDADSKGKLIGHLHSNDFFDVENHPEAQFVIASVETYAGGATSEETGSEFQLANPTHTVTGNLTIRGTTKSITFPAIINVTDSQVSAQAKFNIDRTDWGVSYRDESAVTDKARDQFIHNKVNLGFDVKAIK